MSSDNAKQLIGTATLVILMLIVELICIKVGWSMFITPVFKLAELDWTQAMGFALLASVFKTATRSSLNKD